MKTIAINSRILVAVLFVAVCILGFYSFKTPKTNTKVQYMQVNTVESIIPGGLGRSKMITTKSDGTNDEEKLENLYSMVGINFGNIEANDKDIIAKLNNLTADGWELVQITAGSQSPSQGYEQGIFMTRYLFQKTAE